MSVLSLPKERNVTPLHAFIASSLASFREEGVLNYAIVTRAMENVGKKLLNIYSFSNNPKEAILEANELLHFAEQLSLEEDTLHLYVKVTTSSCNICPKAVGGLELPGRLCPLAGFFSGITGLKPDLENTGREGGFCKIVLSKM
ncbi:MAG: hypothetical protein ACP5GL_01415 [Infirmifilum sp.]